MYDGLSLKSAPSSRPGSSIRLTSGTKLKGVSASRPISASTGFGSTGCSPRWQLPELYKVWSSALTGSELHDRQLPALGRPLHGCNSTPSILSRVSSSAGQRGLSRCSTAAEPSGFTTAKFGTASPVSLKEDASRFQLGNWRSLVSPQPRPNRSGLLSAGSVTSTASKPRIRNGAVWAQWQVHPPSQESEEVLAQDRQRQKMSAYNLCGGPARQAASPARSHAAIQFFGESSSECLPVGALQHVARPPTRQMYLMPNSLESFGLAGSSPTEEDVDQVEDGKQGLSSAQSATRPSAPSRGGRDTPKASRSSICNSRRSTTGRLSISNIRVKRTVADLPDINTVFEHSELMEIVDVMNSYVRLVTPVGTAGSDSLYAAPNDPILTPGPLKDREGPIVSRQIFCRFLLASRLCGTKPGKLSYHDSVAMFDDYATRYEAFAGMPRNLCLRILASLAVPPEAQLSPAAVKDDETRVVPKELREFFKYFKHASNHAKVRQQRLNQRLTKRLLANKVPVPTQTGSTSKDVDEAPAVVWPPLPPRYFAERDLALWVVGVKQWEEELTQQNPDALQALYGHTTTVLLGESLTAQLLEPEVLHFATRFRPVFQELFAEYADGHLVESAIGTSEVGTCDQMSFASFLRFCVDFGLFPRHASFEELRQLYDDAEATEPRQPRLESSVRKKISSQQSAAAAALLPKVQKDWPTKALKDMTEFELKSLFFFAAVDDWLSSRCLRLVNVVASRMPTALEEIEEPTVKHSGNRRPKPSHSDDHKDSEAARVRRPSILYAKDERPPMLSGNDRKGSSSVLSVDEGATATESKPRILPKVQVAMAATLTAGEFLKIVEIPAAKAMMTVDEVDQAFKLLLGVNDEASAPSSRTEVSVYQLDKLLVKAGMRASRLQRESCVLLRPEQELSIGEKACCRFFEALDELLVARSVWDDGRMEDVLAQFQEVDAQVFITLARRMAMSSEKIPSLEDIKFFIDKLFGSSNGSLTRQQAHCILALAKTRREQLRSSSVKAKLLVMAPQDGQIPVFGLQPIIEDESQNEGFGSAAFVEVLLKLTLHRLGSKGLSELQRGAPAWWKCTWLISLLGARFNERVRLLRHEDSLNKFAEKAGCSSFTMSGNEELNMWWHRIYLKSLPQYRPPLDRLVSQKPNLFDPSFAEVQLEHSDDGSPCPLCKERRSPSGWGNPSCLTCGCVEEHCLPLEDHLFAKLLRNQELEEDTEESGLEDEDDFQNDT